MARIELHDGLNIERIVVKVESEDELYDEVRRAVIMAIQFGADVLVYFNYVEFFVDRSKLMNAITRNHTTFHPPHPSEGLGDL